MVKIYCVCHSGFEQIVMQIAFLLILFYVAALYLGEISFTVYLLPGLPDVLLECIMPCYGSSDDNMETC